MSIRIGPSESQSAAEAEARSRTARAEAAYKRATRRREADEAATSYEYGQDHERSQRRAERERMAVTKRWASLDAALGWFRREWQAALPRSLHEVATTVEPDDVLGGPAWKPRWRDYLGRADNADGREPEPIRDAIRTMACGPNRYDRLGARYLFALACQDFDPVRAGWAMRGVCVCLTVDEHAVAPCPALPLSDEWAPWYVMTAIERLRQVVMQRAQRRPGVRIEPHVEVVAA